MEGKSVTVCLMVCSMEDIHTNWTRLHFHFSLLTSFPIKLSNFARLRRTRPKKTSPLHWIIRSLRISGSLTVTEHTPHAKSNTLQESHCTKIYSTPHMMKLLNKCPGLHKK